MFNKLIGKISNYKLAVVLGAVAIIALTAFAVQHIAAEKEEKRQIQIAQQEEQERLERKEKRDEELRKRMSFSTIFDD